MTFSKNFLDKPYGFRLNGVWTLFNTKSEYIKYLNDCIDTSSDVVKVKLFNAIHNLHKGINITDTDFI